MRAFQFGDSLPRVDPDAFVADTATLIGDVSVAAEASLWYGVVARGDLARIVIGRRANVQDGTILHGAPGRPTFIAEDVTIGHNCVIHGARVLAGAVIGSAAVVLDGALVGEGAVIAAGAVVPAGATVPDGSLAGGVPARCLRSVVDPATAAAARDNAAIYVGLAHRYLDAGR